MRRTRVPAAALRPFLLSAAIPASMLAFSLVHCGSSGSGGAGNTDDGGGTASGSGSAGSGSNSSGGSSGQGGQTTSSSGGSSGVGSSGVGSSGVGTSSGTTTSSGGPPVGDGGPIQVAGKYTKVAVYETAKPATTGTHGSSDKLLAKTANIVASSTRPNVVAVTSTQRQTVLGFGVSLTEASVIAMSKLAPADRSNIIDTYFNPAKGHMSFARLPIASCDFSWLPYSYASKPDLSDFSIQHDIDSGLVQLIKDAQTSAGGAGHLNFISSPWSAPPFMKDSNSYYTGSLLSADYGLFAQYIAKYVTAMSGQGIPIWAVTPENEPEHTGGFETMGFNPTTEGSFIAGGLGAAMAGLNPPIKILGFDHNKGTSLTNWSSGLYGNANAKKYLAGIADHWYGSSINPFTDSLDTAYTTIGPGQFLIASEQGLSAIHPPIPTNLWMNDAWYWGANSPDWHCSFPSSSGAATCPANNPLRVGVFRVAEDIISGFNHWESAWLQWNAVTDKWGGPSHEDYGTLTHPGTRAASPYMIDACGGDGSCGQGATPVLSGTQAIYDTPTLYILQHFSKFVLPGGKVLQSSVMGAGVAQTVPASGADPAYSLPDMQALAVANPDQTVAVVLLNEKTTPVDYAITIGNQAVEGTISASALQTIVLSP